MSKIISIRISNNFTNILTLEYKDLIQIKKDTFPYSTPNFQTRYYQFVNDNMYTIYGVVLWNLREHNNRVLLSMSTNRCWTVITLLYFECSAWYNPLMKGDDNILNSYCVIYHYPLVWIIKVIQTLCSKDAF